ncbi:hypothetical protein PFMALIP_01261 [Plasmodium falciparum MaliPS096_E11]|uniref:Uncharacterized protein n=2 Tax=Plasmodium falciparum TaxID=5833 RepID=W7JXX9_PLAFO|nr:hypothetical protein PFMALIP_01261 [Plasmodium falciparum MaliPS096_E11]EWC89903.1 hypothetical protein PFNF54_01294 [Plasmodium falciparum NF54]
MNKVVIISIFFFFFFQDHNNKSINSYNKINSSSTYTHSRILKQLEFITLEEKTVNALQEMLDSVEEDPSEKKCNRLLAKLKIRNEYHKHRKPHNYYARKNKKKEQKRQHLKKNKGKLNRLQQLEEKLFTHADLLRSAIFERTSRVPDGIFYT